MKAHDSEELWALFFRTGQHHLYIVIPPEKRTIHDVIGGVISLLVAVGLVVADAREDFGAHGGAQKSSVRVRAMRRMAMSRLRGRAVIA
jgi:hypothetical protein